MIKKLVNYQYDCVRQAIKSSSFNNLMSSKENKILLVDSDMFAGDDKEVIEIMTNYALNKTTMDLLYSELFIKGEKGRNKIYTPLTYCTACLSREGDKIKLEQEENESLNLGVVAALMDTDEEKIENIVNQLLDVETCDLMTVMGGLLNMDGIGIIKQRAIILAKMPDSTAGLLNELRQISEMY